MAFSYTRYQYLPFCYDCLICSCCTSSPFFHFPNLVKTGLFYILQNFMRKNELVLMGHIKQNIPQFTSGSCNCDNHSVTLFNFTTTQSKISFSKHWEEEHLPFYFSLPICIFINCPDIFGKFHTGFSLPCNPKEWLVSNYPLQYHLLIKHLGHTDKRDDHQLKKVLIIKKRINYHHQHLKRKCMENSMENMNTVWCNQLGEKGLGNV